MRGLGGQPACTEVCRVLREQIGRPHALHRAAHGKRAIEGPQVDRDVSGTAHCDGGPEQAERDEGSPAVPRQRGPGDGQAHDGRQQRSVEAGQEEQAEQQPQPGVGGGADFHRAGEMPAVDVSRGSQAQGVQAELEAGQRQLVGEAEPQQRGQRGAHRAQGEPCGGVDGQGAAQSQDGLQHHDERERRGSIGFDPEQRHQQEQPERMVAVGPVQAVEGRSTARRHVLRDLEVVEGVVLYDADTAGHHESQGGEPESGQRQGRRALFDHGRPGPHEGWPRRDRTRRDRLTVSILREG